MFYVYFVFLITLLAKDQQFIMQCSTFPGLIKQKQSHILNRKWLISPCIHPSLFQTFLAKSPNLITSDQIPVIFEGENCIYVSDLEFHVSVDLLRAELHLLLELLQCQIGLLDLLSLALFRPVQLALHLSSKQAQEQRNEYTSPRQRISAAEKRREKW